MKERDKIEKKNFGKVVISLIIAIILFVALLFIESKVIAPNGTTNVVIATSDIDKGVVITSENVNTYFKEKENVDGELEVSNSIKSLDELIDTKVNSNINKGEVVSQNDVLDKESILADIQEPIEVSLKVEDISQMVGGTVREGDMIDISVVDEISLENKAVLSNVYVNKAFGADGAEISRDNTTSVLVVNVIISKEDEAILNSSLETGVVRISKIK
ncbi:MAG: SAF domain-containing protein [Clostridium paraputrificum]